MPLVVRFWPGSERLKIEHIQSGCWGIATARNGISVPLLLTPLSREMSGAGLTAPPLRNGFMHATRDPRTAIQRSAYKEGARYAGDAICCFNRLAAC